jgi:CRISPR-associated protein Csx14
MQPKQECIMLATLGGQPQVITFALDELLTQGENISEVIIVYLSHEGSRVNHALARVSAEFINDHYAGRPCRLRPMPIRANGARLPDIQSEADAQAAWEMLRDLLTNLKKEQHVLHVCVSGGRRIMALLLMSVAMLQFSYRDKLWHIYTPAEFLERASEGAIMHASPEDGVRLIQVPLTPLGSHFPALRELIQTPLTPPLPGQLNWFDELDRERCEMVIGDLTPRELDTLRAFAAGLSPQAVADKMNITLNTVNTYRRKIFELCRIAWPEQDAIRYHHLREWFGPYFEYGDEE